MDERKANGKVFWGLAVAVTLTAPVSGVAGAGRITGPPFSAEALHALVQQQVDFGPRVPGSLASRKTQNLIQSMLKGRADLLYTPSGYVYSPVDGKTYTVTHVYARFHAAAKDRYLLAAHYDSRPWADRDPSPRNQKRPIPGANDGASGTAVLLDLVRYLNMLPATVGVDVAFVDGEDLGGYDQPDSFCAGATVLTEWMKNGALTQPFPKEGVVVDMVGDADTSIYPEAFSLKANPALVNTLWGLSGELNLPGFNQVPAGHEPESIYDDHLAFTRIGIPTVLLIDLKYRHWHTLQDTPDKVSGAAMARIERLLWTWLARQPRRAGVTPSSE